MDQSISYSVKESARSAMPVVARLTQAINTRLLIRRQRVNRVQGLGLGSG